MFILGVILVLFALNLNMKAQVEGMKPNWRTWAFFALCGLIGAAGLACLKDSAEVRSYIRETAKGAGNGKGN